MTEQPAPSPSPLSRPLFSRKGSARGGARRLAVLALVAFACATGAALPASALETPKGCDVPPEPGHGHTFYIDPEHGSMWNDGSAARPWRTLAEVLAPNNHMVATRKWRENTQPWTTLPVNPNGPIKPGDTLVLMSGNHGDIDIRQYVNDAFISVIAGKGQSPVAGSLYLLASSHWLFRGIKFQKVKPANTPPRTRVLLANLASHGWIGPSDNVIFVDNSISTEDSTAAWTDQDWVDRPYDTAFSTSARCTTFANNHIYNVRDAVYLAGSDVLVQDNLIERFGNDGIDVTASNTIVRRNLIRNGMHTDKDYLHPDGIQGWGTPKNVVIDSNRVINLDHPMQGIDVFTGHFDGLRVTNNLVIVVTWNGMTIVGVDNLSIVNNTVLSGNPTYTTWILTGGSKEDPNPKNVVVRNNIATMLRLGKAECDHNIAQLALQCGRSDSPAHDPRIDHNLVDKSILRSIGFDLKDQNFEFRPSPRSTAYKAGSEEDAPPYDITGRKRVAPYDIGAFAR